MDEAVKQLRTPSAVRSDSSSPMPTAADAAIGIFDSGIGGLSVLRHIHAALPREQLLYFADSGYAPYGDKTEAQIVERSLAIASFLLEQRVKALVVACNTATAAAIQAIRTRWPQLLVVGIEPGLKPAAQLTRSRTVGVLATRSTLASQRFALLQAQMQAQYQVRYLPQACVGLVDLIEKGELHSPATVQLLERYLAPLLEQGADTLVLGCTHYPFVRPAIESVCKSLVGETPDIIDTGQAVTRQLQRLLEAGQLQTGAASGSLAGFTTASRSTLENAFRGLLKLDPPVQALQPQGGG
ncbi:glutamate racemase [Herbaspirillum seropedicae]|uniref:Glutamate racemase n=1 Tax=Herbaspirillum seropedicae (strain SmR1) TaxID=757424 RepID=D8IQ10_HERSS|nr:glutamate racemase protein [Herbaspirillum seropedicae SmR1]AKN65134.1 glutamate racemase [Herbaspirillum seropedicae]NQE32183.1 glutamate racemase [Herbaspirillum seropedicae]UMU21085.1 glutamate racemase [Herbaspirillum seropedicae]